MTREQLREMGVSEENIEKIMADFGKASQKANRADQYKADAEEAQKLKDELQKKLDEIASQNMTDIEKANKERDDALNSINSLQSQIRAMEMKAKFAEKGITGENADKLLASLGSGEFDVEVLGQIIADREMAAANAKVQEIASKSTNPGGGQGGTTPEKTKAEEVAEMVGKTLGGVGKNSTDIINSYK